MLQMQLLSVYSHQPSAVAAAVVCPCGAIHGCVLVTSKHRQMGGRNVGFRRGSVGGWAGEDLLCQLQLGMEGRSGCVGALRWGHQA